MIIKINDLIAPMLKKMQLNNLYADNSNRTMKIYFSVSKLLTTEINASPITMIVITIQFTYPRNQELVERH